MNLTSEQLVQMGYVMVPDPCNPGRATWVKSKTIPLKHAKAPLSHAEPPGDTKTPKRIRQSTKPLLNKLEQAWFDYASAIYHERIMPQSLGFRLGNGVVYWPDFVSHSFTHAWEIKGRQPIQDDSVVKIKVAARLYPQIKWSLVWKQDGHWKDQIVLP